MFVTITYASKSNPWINPWPRYLIYIQPKETSIARHKNPKQAGDGVEKKPSRELNQSN